MMMVKTRGLLFLLAALVALAGRPDSAPATPEAHPVVVELFTSQGCYSCPPADRFLGELRLQEDVLALAFHVDYWDYIGWKDPFALPASTARQRQYGKAMNLWSIYTPQMVIDGRLEGVGSKRIDISRKITKVSKMSPSSRVSVPVSLSQSGSALTVTVGDGDAPETGDIWLVAYDDSRITSVPRGENAGKTLTEFNIVRGIWHLGHWDGRARQAEHPLADIPDGVDHVAVLLQAERQGPIYGAGSIPLQ